MILALILLLFCLSPALAATDFDSLTLRENCNHSNTLNTGNWTNQVLTTHASTLEGNGSRCVRDTVGGTGGAWWDTETFGPDVAFAATMTLNAPDDSDNIQLWLRLTDPGTANVDGYVCQFFSVGTGQIQLNVFTNGSFVDGTTCSPLSNTIDATEKVACEIIGTTIKAYVKQSGVWTEECSRIDATYSSAGYVGLSLNDPGFRLDDLLFDTLISTLPAGSEGLWYIMQ